MYKLLCEDVLISLGPILRSGIAESEAVIGVVFLKWP